MDRRGNKKREGGGDQDEGRVLERREDRQREREGDQHEGREGGRIDFVQLSQSERDKHVEVAAVNEEEAEEYGEEETLIPDKVRMGRQDDVDFMVKKLDMFEFGWRDGGRDEE